MILPQSRIEVLPTSRCLHPRSKKVFDHFFKGWKTVVYPCGKCWNCIHSFRESWRIRLYETLIAQSKTEIGGFIYDTLTVADEHLPLFPLYDEATGELQVDCKELEIHCGRSLKILEHYKYHVPFLAKATVSAWLESGRNRYNYHYRREIESGKKSRLSIKYFGALEYGPLWSRPHVHICVTGISRRDYLQFFAQPWRKNMGFTKTKFVDLRRNDQADKHASRIACYISKYLLKGSYESDLVKYGFVPRAWRIVSHGIGLEYLENPFNHKFDFMRNDMRYFMACRVAADSNSNSELYLDSFNYAKKFISLHRDRIRDLSVYVKDGYKHSLPRYYIDIMCNTHNKGLAGCAVRSAKEESACYDYLERVARHLTSYSDFAGKDAERICALLLESPRLLNTAIYRYSLVQDVENARLAKWHKLQTSNTNKRIAAAPKTIITPLLL